MSNTSPDLTPQDFLNPAYSQTAIKCVHFTAKKVRDQCRDRQTYCVRAHTHRYVKEIPKTYDQNEDFSSGVERDEGVGELKSMPRRHHEKTRAGPSTRSNSWDFCKGGGIRKRHEIRQ